MHEQMCFQHPKGRSNLKKKKKNKAKKETHWNPALLAVSYVYRMCIVCVSYVYRIGFVWGYSKDLRKIMTGTAWRPYGRSYMLVWAFAYVGICMDTKWIPTFSCIVGVTYSMSMRSRKIMNQSNLLRVPPPPMDGIVKNPHGWSGRGFKFARISRGVVCNGTNGIPQAKK